LASYVIDVPLSVLDLSPVAVGTTSGQALQQTTELARRTEELGYRRFWVAEHHNMPSIASSAPAVLIAHLAASTSSIRLGSGGVMLPNHAPLVVAEQFGTLEALHPGRIDLGIGRAPGTDQRTALALRRTMEGLSAEAFPEELQDLIALFTGDENGPPITARPGRGDMPAIWLLGSSGICADTNERARWLSGPAALSFIQLRSGHPQPLVTPEEAAAYEFSPMELAFAQDRFADQAVGSVETVTRQLSDLLERTEADELMLTAMVYDINDRARSFELIAEKVAGGLHHNA
jgi:alkanesulfonate monooxygenase SsuD/methylene tetrahydromethanopterin reductase-like flavin-dependent oxidoreductase (luciferase family)